MFKERDYRVNLVLLEEFECLQTKEIALFISL